jgi:hypothetical protein
LQQHILNLHAELESTRRAVGEACRARDEVQQALDVAKSECQKNHQAMHELNTYVRDLEMRFEDIEGAQGGSGASTGASRAAPAAVAGPPTAAAAKTGSSGASGASSGASGASGAAPAIAAPAAAAAARTRPAPAHGLLTEVNIYCWTGQKFPIAISADALVQDLEDKIIDMLASDPTYEEAYNLAKSRGLQLIYKGRTLIHKLNKLDCYVPLANSFDIVVHVFVCKRKNPC